LEQAMKNIKRFLPQVFRAPEQHKTAPSSDSSAMAQKVVEMIAHTAEVELTCDEVFELIDQFTEMTQRGENIAELMPMVQHHLELCPDCREEYEALKRVLEDG
jgi:hypothetical protein